MILLLDNGFTITITSTQLILTDAVGGEVESAQRLNPALQNKVCEWCQKYDGECDCVSDIECHLFPSQLTAEEKVVILLRQLVEKASPEE